MVRAFLLSVFPPSAIQGIAPVGANLEWSFVKFNLYLACGKKHIHILSFTSVSFNSITSSSFQIWIGIFMSGFIDWEYNHYPKSHKPKTTAEKSIDCYQQYFSFTANTHDNYIDSI